MNEDEFLQDFVLLPPDDLPPGTRECFLASRKGDRRHKWNCPDCLEEEPEVTLMDAASHDWTGTKRTHWFLRPKPRSSAARPRSSGTRRD